MTFLNKYDINIEIAHFILNIQIFFWEGIMSKGIILLIEDERSVSELYKMILTEEFPDFEVLLLDTYEEAMETILAKLDQIKIGFFDEKIFGSGTGSDLAEEMRKQGFTGPLISISGEEDLKERLVFFNVQLKKPFALADFQTLAHKHLG